MIARIRQYILEEQYAAGLVGLFVNPFYISRSGLRREIGKMALEMSGNLLDVGCGRKPYRAMFSTNEYVGLEIDTPDNRVSKQADVFYDGNVFPFFDDSFNGVVCNQVLEHVFKPDQFLGEIHRVLRSDGLLLLGFMSFPVEPALPPRES